MPGVLGSLCYALDASSNAMHVKLKILISFNCLNGEISCF